MNNELQTNFNVLVIVSANAEWRAIEDAYPA